MDLEGRSKGLGLGMKAGIEAALKDQTINGHRIQFVTLNDSYNPSKTIEATNRLIEKNVLLFAGNVGTPTAKVSLPILAKNKIPAIGFFTGAGLLRSRKNTIINYRASYVQETKAVIDEALKQGLTVENICAYVQNDAYGMAGVMGIRRALENKSGGETVLKALDAVLHVSAKKGSEPERNGIGPVGVYMRNTFMARAGYDSLKAWEKKQGSTCRLIVTVGSYASIARFIAYAKAKRQQQQQQPWIFSAVSFTGADNFLTALNSFSVHDHVIMTQVVPLADSKLAIVQAAQTALGKDYGYVSQEGYIVGKLLLYGLKKLEKNDEVINRENLIAVYQGKRFDLEGLEMDFSSDNQGSDFVVMTALKGDQWLPVKANTWHKWLNDK
ncbi:MAG TPA: branched-chain amino acid ABC transporter substrate-binding protein [Thiothrix sp.]|nr:branched-chain amino acid ABC transporter substrate-binding protein [Thiothrix sp.]